MRNWFRKARQTAAIGLIASFLIAGPAYARYESDTLYVRLSNVDRYGNLSSYYGQTATFYALINTRTGRFCGNARGRVSNASGRFQCYRNVNLFNAVGVAGSSGNGGNYYFVTVSCSLYSVDRNGYASYCAEGRLEDEFDV